ncbi:MAG: sulfotransferase [Nitriliruptorales bacterium]|nr:sulfotransferase [Nitriliruptorales bacterium]
MTPFLVVGAGRGGTSLVAGLLDHHPDLEVAFEAFSHTILLGRPLPDEVEGSAEARAAAFVAACRRQAATRSTRWGNKITTEQIAGLEVMPGEEPSPHPGTGLAAFANAVRGIPIVFVVRDPRTCVRSKMSRAGMEQSEAVRRWRYAVAAMDTLAAEPSTLRIRFEDLVLQPLGVLPAVCRHLGVPYVTDMLSGVENAKMVADYRRPGLDRAPLRVSEPLPGESDLTVMAQRLGYA